MTAVAVYALILAGMVLVVGAYELGLKLGWLARDKRAREEIAAVQAEFRETRGRHVDTRA